MVFGWRNSKPSAVPDAGLNPDELSDRELDHRILRGSSWIAVSYGGRNVLSLLSMLVLVRLLEPSAFGLLALASTVILVIEYLQESGLSSAVVQRRENVREAAGSALIFAPLAGGLLYAVAFVAAPSVAQWFDAPQLKDVLRVLSLVLVLRGFGIVPNAILERELRFKDRTKSELSAALAQVSVALSLAFSGAGVWSLVGGQLAASAVSTTIVWFLIPWRPSPRAADWTVLREMFRYGRFVTGTNIVNLLNNTLDTIVVGRFLNPAALGFYAVAYRLSDMPNAVIGYVLGRVMFPVYSLLQQDFARFRRTYLQNLQRNALFALPTSVALIVATEPIVLALLGAKWLPAVTPLRILAVVGLVTTFVAPSGEVFRGAGKPHLGFIFAVPHALLFLPALLLLVPRFGITGAAAAILIVRTVMGIPAMVASWRLMGLRSMDVARALGPSALCSAVLAVTLLLLVPSIEALGPVATLALLTASGILIYATATAIFARKVVIPMWTNLRAPRA
jgi:O-antigen/teichoic acid export membrane protein